MAKKSSKFKPRKQKRFLNALLPYALVAVVMSLLITYLWIYTEVDETLKELEFQQFTVNELSDDIKNLKDDIEYYSRVDVLTARAINDLGMVYTAPETIAIYVEDSYLVND